MIAPRALIFDADAGARRDLRGKLAAHCDILVLAEAATLRDARLLLRRPDYNVVFLDVRFADGNAFELVPAMPPKVGLIFVTAHRRYAAQAFEVDALDYLLKPVAPRRLATAVQRLTTQMAPAKPSPGGGSAHRQLRLDEKVCLRSGRRARFAPLADIVVIAACDNYSEVRLADGSMLLLRLTLESWEKSLPAAHFMRVHRTRIVNLHRVARYERDRNERTRLHVEGIRSPIFVSRQRWAELCRRLARFGQM